MIVIERRPSRRQLRQFSAIALAFFGAAGGWMYSRGNPVLAGIAWGLAAVVGGGGLVSLTWARITYLACIYLTYPIGIALSWVNLAIVYYLVLTPTALVLRLFGRDALGLKYDPRRASYWRRREDPPGPERYFEQF